MKITILGSGNVATHLALALRQAGHQIVQIWSRDFDHAEQLAELVYAEPTNRLNLLYPTSDVYILAVSDDALFDLALDFQMREALVVHTSGSVSMNVLRPMSRHYGVLYAPQSFVRTVAMDYSQLPFCLEASDEESMKKLEMLARSVSENIYHISSSERQWLHVASVMVNNFGNALNALAQDLLKKQGISFEILRPLIQITAEKAMLSIKAHDNPEEEPTLWRLQTGPAVRGDEKTLSRHVAMLKESPDLQRLYEMMTEIIINATSKTK